MGQEKGGRERHATAPARSAMPAHCEDCALRQPSFGLPAEGRTRWCGGCAKAHAGARDVTSKRCEDCALKQPGFGLPAEGRKRWCVGCAKAHAGAQSLRKRRRGSGARTAAQAKPPKRRAPVAEEPTDDWACPVCSEEWQDGVFMFGCEACLHWYHPKCVKVRASDAGKIDKFYCPDCQPCGG